MLYSFLKLVVLSSFCFVALAVEQVTKTVEPFVEMISWKDIIKSGGWFMYVLLFVSIVMVAVVIYFFLVLRYSMIGTKYFHSDVVDKIRSGAIMDAKRICEYNPTPLAAIALAGIEYVRDTETVDPVILRDIMEGEGTRQAESLLGQTQLLLDIGVIAPMIGLLGTVWGMLRAFSAVAINIASAKPAMLAQGVSQALITTIFGLFISIPAMIFYAYFRRRASKMISDLEECSTDILISLLKMHKK